MSIFKILLLSLSLFVFSSCTEGEKVIPAEGAKGIIPPFHDIPKFSNPPSPIPPDDSFAPDHPFDRLSSPFVITIAISNFNELPYTHKWYLNGTEYPFLSSNQNETPRPFYVNPGNTTQFPRSGFQTLTSTIFDEFGKKLESQFWSFNIVSAGDPFYNIPGFDPLPAPELFPDSPMATSTAPFNITAVVDNPGNEKYLNKWFLNGTEDITLRSNESNATKTYPVDPGASGIGNYTVVNQITEPEPDDHLVIDTVTWNFVVRGILDPTFSTFTGQDPAPAPFPPINFGSALFPLDPDPLNNPDNLPFIIEWQLDGALMASNTYIYLGGPSDATSTDDPPPFYIDPNDIDLYPAGMHSVVATLFDKELSNGGKILQSVNWTFEIIVGGAAILESVFPATNTGQNAISSVPLNGSPTGGFYESDTDPMLLKRRRGTPLPTSSFCVEINDGTGLGGAGSAVQVTYFSDDVYNPLGAITPPLVFATGANPPQICLDGSGAENSGDGVPDYTLAFDPPNALGTSDTRFISARIVDKLSNQEVVFVTWTIDLQPANTSPVIDYITGNGETEDGDTVAQDQMLTFSVMVEDKDSRDTPIDASDTSNFGWDEDYSIAFSLRYNTNVTPLDGSSTFISADCTRDVSETFPPGSEQDKFDCVFAIPSFDGDQPAPAGDYEVSSIVADTLTNSIGATLTSNDLKWSLTVTESNTTPTVLNWVPVGDPVDNTTQSFVYRAGFDTVAINAATEKDDIIFNLHIGDNEKDNFNIKASYNTSSDPATFTEFYSATNQTIATESWQIFPNPIPLEIPDITVTGAASATITYRVEVTDIPDEASPLTLTFDIPLVITDLNDPPEFSTPTGSVNPALNATATVVEGYPFTFTVDNITDPTDVDGAGIEWQWQVQSDCGNPTPTGYQSIIDAIQPPGINPSPAMATLTWSPPAHLNQIESCFRNCVGDNGFGNPADCSILTIGPWQGIGDGAVEGIQADSTFSDFYIRQANIPSTDVWMDDATRTLYSVHARGNQIVLAAKVYNVNGTIDDSDHITFPTVEGENQASNTQFNNPANLSITGNNDYIFVSYLIFQEPPPTGNPVGGIVKVKRTPDLDSSTAFYGPIPHTLGGIGNVVANNTGAYLPYLRKDDGDSIRYVWIAANVDGAPTVTEVDPGLGISASSLVSELDSTNNSTNKGLALAAHLKNGLVNAYYFDLPAAAGAMTKSSEKFDVFGGKLINFYTMGVGKFEATNNKTYFSAQETNQNLIFTSLDTDDFSVQSSIDTFATATYPGLTNIVGIEAVASKEASTFYLGALIEDVPDQFNAYVLRIVGDGSTFDTSKDLSKRVNVTIDQNFSFINNSSFSLSQVDDDFVIGEAGAVLNENRKDTLWFRYLDNSTTRTTIINVVPETFSGSTPTDEQNEDWTRPWFIK